LFPFIIKLSSVDLLCTPFSLDPFLFLPVALFFPFFSFLADHRRRARDLHRPDVAGELRREGDHARPLLGGIAVLEH